MEQYIVNCLPHKKQALFAMAVTRTLSARATITLGIVETQYAYDPICITALEEYV